MPHCVAIALSSVLALAVVVAHSKSTHFFTSNARQGSIWRVNNLLTVLFSALRGCLHRCCCLGLTSAPAK